MYLYIFLALVVVVVAVVMYRSSTPIARPKPSDFFPWKGIITDIIKKSNESKDVKHHIRDEEISVAKKIYNEVVDKFFKLLVPQTKDILKFEEGQFEKIVASVVKVLNEELMAEDKASAPEVREMRQKAIGKIAMPILFGNFIVGGPMGANPYATYDKYKDELKPMLDIFYKGPAFPTMPPAEMGMKPVKPPTATLKPPTATLKLPSEYFPYKGFIDTHLNDVMIFKKSGEGHGLNLKQKEIFKSFYNEQMKNFFERINRKTKKLRSFKPNQFEEIFKMVFGQMFGDLNRRKMDKKYKEETKLLEIILPQLIGKLLKDSRIVRGQHGPDFYATYKNQIYDMHSFLSAFYKGPPLPTKGPKTCKYDEKNKNGKCVKIMCPNRGKLTGRNVGNNMVECRFPFGNGGSYTNVYQTDNLPELVSSPVFSTPASSPRATSVCSKDEKNKNGRCVKIMCPPGSTMTGNHVSGMTECLKKFKNGSSSSYMANSSLPERVSSPVFSTPASSPVCSKHKKMKNGKCVRVTCPLGTAHTGQILKRGNGFMHSCKNNKTGMVELIPNEKLHEAK